MTRHPLMADPTMSIVEAQHYMGENNIRHLPIVGDGKRLLGLITRRRLLVDPSRLDSLDVWDIARTLSELTVKQVMIKAKRVVTVSQDTTIEEAARIMVEKKIGCLPVLEEGVVIGIITEADMLNELANLLGAYVHGVRVTMRVPDKVGEFAKITSAIASKGWGIYASGSVPEPKNPGQWLVVVKVRNAPKDELIAILETIEGQEIVDVREVHG